MSRNKEQIGKIKKLKADLKDIEDALKPKRKWINEKIKNLEEILEDLLQMRYDISVENADRMFKIIDINLPDEMKLLGDNNEYITILFEEEEVGSIEILEECRPDLKIRVRVFVRKKTFRRCSGCFLLL